MDSIHAILIHLDNDQFDGIDDAHVYDAGASLRALAIQTHDAVSARYPNALISVTWDAWTSGRSRCNVTNPDGVSVDPCARDNVRETCGFVYESWNWAVSAEGV